MAIDHYEIRVDGGAWVDVGIPAVVSSKHQHDVTGLTAATEYDFEVRAVDTAGNASAPTAIVSETTDVYVPPYNVALSSNGATATATTETSGFEAVYANNGFRHTENSWNPTGGWSAGAGQATGTLTIAFGASRTITEINVFTLADSVNYNTDPTLSDTFTTYGIIDFTVEYWNGSTWVVVTGGTVTANDKVWRQFTFSAITTTQIRVAVTDAASTEPRIVELEAWGN